KVLFMSDQNQQSHATNQPVEPNTLQEISDIKRMMERSSRFISLSGLSGIAAGLCALVGAYIAHGILKGYYYDYNTRSGFTSGDFSDLKFELLLLAAIILATALIASFFFTWRRAKQNRLPVWDLTARKLMWNMLIPLVAGGFFILTM